MEREPAMKRQPGPRQEKVERTQLQAEAAARAAAWAVSEQGPERGEEPQMEPEPPWETGSLSPRFLLRFRRVRETAAAMAVAAAATAHAAQSTKTTLVESGGPEKLAGFLRDSAATLGSLHDRNQQLKLETVGIFCIYRVFSLTVNGALVAIDSYWVGQIWGKTLRSRRWENPPTRWQLSQLSHWP